MSIGFYNINNNQTKSPAFKSDKIEAGILTKPIETVQKTIETGVDTFVPTQNESKERKRNKKRAIAAGSVVIVLGALTMLLNPKSSGRIMRRLQSWQKQLEIQVQKDKDNFFKSKFYNFYKKILSGLEKTGNLYFNLNSSKDVAFQSMCLNSNKKYPEFITKNETVHKVIKTLDDGFVKVFKKPHEKITVFFDNISRNTVKNKYKRALKDLDKYESTLKLLQERLPDEKRLLVDTKLKEINKAKKIFSGEQLMERFNKQEKLMAGLDQDLWNKIYNKKDGFAKNSTTFWVQDALKDKKAVVEKEGAEIIAKFFGDKNKKGLYNDALDVYREHLSTDDMKFLENSLKNVEKRIKKANFSECSEYFDKKRDLMVGGAPTDILTQIFGIGLCGWAVNRADKEKRLQKAFTNGLPIVTGLGSSLIFSALLYSGGVGLMAGAAVSGVTSLICHYIDKNIFGNKDPDDENENTRQEQNNQKIQTTPQEVKYA